MKTEHAADKAQEWTSQTVYDLYRKRDGGFRGIADAHNAALAAEREKATNEERLRWQQVHHDFTEALKERQQLRVKLIAM